MRVTVIIPCYNVESYINECVESVRRQSHQDVEIICVDNGSTDRTLEKLEELPPGALLNSAEQLQMLDIDRLHLAGFTGKGINIAVFERLVAKFIFKIFAKVTPTFP